MVARQSETAAGPFGCAAALSCPDVGTLGVMTGDATEKAQSKRRRYVMRAGLDTGSPERLWVPLHDRSSLAQGIKLAGQSSRDIGVSIHAAASHMRHNPC